MNRSFLATGATALTLVAFAAPAQAELLTPHASAPRVITPLVAAPASPEPGVEAAAVVPSAPGAPAIPPAASGAPSGLAPDPDDPDPHSTPEPPEPKKSIFSPVVEPFEKLVGAVFCLASNASYDNFNRSYDVLRGSIRAYAGLTQTFDSSQEESVDDSRQFAADAFAQFHATQQGFIRSCFTTRAP